MRAAILLGLMLSAATHAADSLQEAMAELQPSSLAVAAQRAELAWFAEAGKPFAGPLVRGQRAGAAVQPPHRHPRDS